MKKIIAILLSCAALFTMTTTVFATVGEGQTELSLTLDADMENYELVIPPSVEIDLSQDETIFNVKVQNISLVWSKRVKVYVSSANPDTESGLGAFLVNKDGSGKKIHYKMYVPRDYEGTETLVGETTSSLFTTNVGVEVDGTFPGSGTYTDTLTFRVVAE